MLTNSSPEAASQFDENVFDTDQVLKILNDYYILADEKRDDYPEELRGFYDMWHVDKMEADRRHRANSKEVKQKRVADTINAMARYLESFGVDAAEYKAPHGRFYIRMATDIDPAKPDGFYRDENIALFMREALSFVNILTRKPKMAGSDIGLSDDERLERIRHYLITFPPSDNDLYRCLAGVRDAQMTAYMALKAEEMPWRDRMIVECHRGYIDEWRAKVVRYIDEAYLTHTFSALEHLFGIEVKEKDTLEAVRSIPAETACMVLAQYQRKMQDEIRERTQGDREEMLRLMNEANEKGYLLEADFKKMQEFLLSRGVVNIEIGSENISAVEYLTMSKEAILSDGIKYDNAKIWDLKKINNIFPDVVVNDSLAIPRPESLFDNFEGSDSDASLRIANLVCSDDKKDQKAGLQYLSLISLESQAGSSFSQFLNFIHQIGLLQGAKSEAALEVGISYIRKEFSDNEIAQEIVKTYEAIPEDYNSYKMALGSSAKPKLEDVLGKKYFFQIREVVDKDAGRYIEILKKNKKILRELIHHPKALYILESIFRSSSEIDSKDLQELGKNLAFLGAKFNIELATMGGDKIHLLDYVKSGFSEDFRRKFPHQNIGHIMLEEGLGHSEINVDGFEVSGLEYLAQNNFKKLKELYSNIIIFSQTTIESLLERPLSDGQNLIHKLARRGDTTVIGQVLSLVDYREIGKLLTMTAGESKKTPLHFAVTNAILNPSQSGIIDVLMKRMGEAGVLDYDVWAKDEKNPLIIAIESERTDIIARVAGNLAEHNSDILLEVLYGEHDFLKSRSIIKALVSKLSEEHKGHLLMHYIKTGNVKAFEAITSMDGFNIFFTTEFEGREQSPLHVAAASGNADFVNYWMVKERYMASYVTFPSSIRDGSRKTAMMLAVDNDKFDIVKLLIEKGAVFDVDEQKYVFGKILQQLHVLKIRYCNGENSAEVAEEIRNKKDFLSYLLDTNQAKAVITGVVPNPPLIKAATKQRWDIAQALIETGRANVLTDVSNRGDTILHYACLHDQHNLIKYLTDSEANGGLKMDPKIKNTAGKEPIERAQDAETRIMMEGIIRGRERPAGVLSPLKSPVRRVSNAGLAANNL